MGFLVFRCRSLFFGSGFLIRLRAISIQPRGITNDKWSVFFVVGLQPTIEGARVHRVSFAFGSLRPVLGCGRLTACACGMGYAALSGLHIVAFTYRGLRSQGSLHPRLLSAAPLGLGRRRSRQFRIKNSECRIAGEGEGKKKGGTRGEDVAFLMVFGPVILFRRL